MTGWLVFVVVLLLCAMWGGGFLVGYVTGQTTQMARDAAERIAKLEASVPGTGASA